jgi:S1-C subfamily serine protease
MYLQPNSQISAPQLFDASGVAFRPEDGAYQVDFVLPETAGARAGLREGDVLVEVDGHALQDVTPLQLRDLMSHPGETRNLRLLRNGQTLRIALVLENRL